MIKTTFIFVDASLELIPPKLLHNELVKKTARKKGKSTSEILLDSSYHYKVIQNLPDSQKRGRPDIIHFCLLSLLGSRLVKNDKLDQIEIYVQTINDLIIKIEPYVRLPRNYNRFVGLMEKLLVTNVIKSKDQTLMQILDDTTPKEIFEVYPSENRLLFTSRGDFVDLLDFMNDYKKDNVIIGIGAFPHGQISNKMHKYFDKKIAISSESLDTWIVVSEVAFTRNYTLDY